MGTGSLITNQYKYMSDSWHPGRNPGSDLPIPNSQDNIPNDRFVHDASFLRLKNLSVSYTLATEERTGKWLRAITVSVSGNNLLLWEKYNGYDPEVSTSRVGSTLRRMDDGGLTPRTAQ